MIKKFMVLAMALSAFVAFAAPAIAQGDELYEESGGTKTPLKVGSEITLTSTNLKTVSPLGTLECTKVTIHGEVTKNGPTITGKEKSTTVEGCNHTITDPTAGSVELGGGTGKTTGTKFIVDGICTYTGSVGFTYKTNTNTVTVNGTLTGSPSFLCGNGTMTGTFTIETSNGTSVFIS